MRLRWLRSSFVVSVFLFAFTMISHADESKLNSGQGESPVARPNIVFIFSDDHAYQAMSCYGSEINKTPNLDRLASSGMRFDRCLVTNSICGPSRAVILTGKYSHLNGFRQNGDKFDGEQVTFPKLLQQAGYQTAIFGKWHLNCEPTGFDQWKVLPGQGVYYNPKFLTPDGEVDLEGYTTELIGGMAIDWLKAERDQDKPFMMMVQHKAPHREWLPSLSHINDFDGEKIAEPKTLFDDYATRSSLLAENEMEIADHMRPAMDLRIWDANNPPAPFQNNVLNRMTEAQRKPFEEAYADENADYLANPLEGDARTKYYYQRYIKDYLRCIASVDDSVGQILDYLDEAGLSKNTIVIYSSDQGFYLGEHGWYDKRWIFEQSLRTPLLVRWPGVTEPGTSSKKMVSNLDFAQTFLEMAGVEAPDDMQGMSLAPILKGEAASDWRTAFYYHYYELHTHHVPAHEGVVTDRYKLIHYYQKLNADRKPVEIDDWDLMDLGRDPLEVRSFIDESDYAGLRDDLKKDLARLRMQFQVDPQPE
ncbi:MAG: sulfatase [Pirellulaceae bacterium]